jgi:hypothetical protein
MTIKWSELRHFRSLSRAKKIETVFILLVFLIILFSIFSDLKETYTNTNSRNLSYDDDSGWNFPGSDGDSAGAGGDSSYGDFYGSSDGGDSSYGDFYDSGSDSGGDWGDSGDGGDGGDW